MEYKRYMKNSNEYKELINNINKEINTYKYNINKLEKEKNNLFNIIVNNHKIMDELEIKHSRIKNQLYNNIKKEQKRKDVLDILFPGLLTSAVMISAATISPDSTAFISSTLIPMGSSIGLGTIMLALFQYTNPICIIENKTETKALEKEENYELNEKAKEYNLEREERRENYYKDIQKYEDINKEIRSKKKDMATIQNKKKKLIAIAKGYDNVNDYQRMVTASAKKEHKEKVYLPKTLKRVKN